MEIRTDMPGRMLLRWNPAEIEKVARKADLEKQIN
jgi:hypothetical protein